MGIESFPFIIGWELTLECNLRCRHCGSAAGRARPNELTTAECLRICDQMPELLVQEVNFTGGEPLLRSDLFDILGHLKDLEIPTKVLTNGLLLTPTNIDQLRAVGVAGVGVSVDGCPATHDRIRSCPGMHQQLFENIRAVIAAGIEATVITTANALNIGELPMLRDILAALRVPRWQVQPVFPLGRSRRAPELVLDAEDYNRLGAFGQECLQAPDYHGMEIFFGDSYGYYTELDTRQPSWGGCPAGLVSCGITSQGKIKGCLSLPDHMIEGDLRQNDLWDIWFNPEAFHYNRAFCSADLGENCRNCEMAERCRGGCTAMSYGSSGKPHNDPLCFTGLRNRGHRIFSDTATAGTRPTAK